MADVEKFYDDLIIINLYLIIFYPNLYIPTIVEKEVVDD